MGQLTLDGREVEEVRDRRRTPRLTGAQATVMRHVAEHGSIRTTEAGVILHKSRARCAGAGQRWTGFKGGGVACCPYAAADGLELLKRLAGRGLLERVGRGVWAPPQPS